MPELTAIHLVLLVLALVSGVALGWIARSDRATRDRIAVNAGWQEQFESRQSEHQRLAEQNRGLMEQISLNQAAKGGAAAHTKELTAALKEAVDTRAELERQLQQARNNLQMMTATRNRLQADYAQRESRLKSAMNNLSRKDEKIASLKRELGNWHSRLPPLVEKFRERNQEATDLLAELEAARVRIQDLESMDLFAQTRIEPVEAGTLPGGLFASNEPHTEHPLETEAAIREQSTTTTRHDNVLHADQEARTGRRDFEHASLTSETAAPAQSYVDASRANGKTDPVRDKPFAFRGDAEVAEVRDDLKQIKGIGPAIEKTLHNLGIRRFSQLAEISEYDIDRVAQQLKGFRSRIYREDWLGQARDLHYQNTKNRS